MADEAMTQGEAKKAKIHEAHMIPGVDGHRVFGFPNTIITKLRYCDVFNLQSTLGSCVQYVFAANGIFDPDISGVGHQPMYRDNYASLYDQYVVIGSKIKVTFSNTGTNAAIVGINGDDDSAGSTTLSTKMEQNNSKWIQLGAYGSGIDTATVTCTFEPLRDFGVGAKDDGSSATAQGSNPNELWCYQAFMAANNAGSLTVQCAVEIDYTVKFTELITPTQN